MSTIFTLEKIFKAYNDCRKGKKGTINALKFEYEREKNIVGLLNDLVSRNYKISRHICFIVTEPKPREIFAADFRDRIVHHLLYNEIKDLFEKDFISTSYANRIGKGTHRAVARLKLYVNNNSCKKWNLKLDVKNFFCSINKDILFNILSMNIAKNNQDDLWKSEIIYLCKKIIFHDPTSNYFYKGDPILKFKIPKNKSLFNSAGNGLPIGNLTSQFFANVYLNELDQFVTRQLGFNEYIRYVDDFVIVGDEKNKLVSVIEKIDEFLLTQLVLRLHPKKIYLQPSSHGVDFLGYFIKPTHTLVRRSVVKRFRKKLNACIDDNGFVSIGDIPMIRSYMGHFEHADSWNLIKSLDS